MPKCILNSSKEDQIKPNNIELNVEWQIKSFYNEVHLGTLIRSRFAFYGVIYFDPEKSLHKTCAKPFKEMMFKKSFKWAIKRQDDFKGFKGMVQKNFFLVFRKSV